jgi:hypothetical protein
MKVSLVLLVSQDQSTHFLIRHHAQMSLPGGITCQASVSVQAVASRGMVLLCWCDLKATELTVHEGNREDKKL